MNIYCKYLSLSILPFFSLSLHAMSLDQKLIHAAKRGFFDAALISAGADINTQDEKGKTALIWAIGKDYKNTVEHLLKAGATSNTQDHKNCSALMWAAIRGNKDITSLLLQHKVNVNVQDTTGWTALMYATYHRRKDIVKLLLKYDADVTIKSKRGKTALDIARENNYQEIEAMLITSIRASAKKKLVALRKAAIENMMQQPEMPYVPKELVEHVQSYV